MTPDGQHKILIVDDEDIFRKQLAALLEEECELILAKNGEQALKRIGADDEIDLMILDVMMPGMDGHEVLSRLKQTDDGKDMPVIFITALNSFSDEERGLKIGAADYISKPFHPGIVQLRVQNHLRFVRQRKLLETLVGHDGLTEIPNRRRFDEMLEKEWRRAARSGIPLSLIILDVDYFKNFNDTYGHAQGDAILKRVAGILDQASSRPFDLAARFGGEEFVILMPETAHDGAARLAEQVRAEVEAAAIPHADSSAADVVTISVGAATLIPDLDRSPTQLVEAADGLLYQAKAAGRNRAVSAEVTLQAATE